MNALVVPTNRPEALGPFLEAWSPLSWDLVIVVQDGPQVTVQVPDHLMRDKTRPVEVFSWHEIDQMLPDASIVSRGDSAIRSFGFWKAWAAGADVIFTLDDDCYPVEGTTSQAFVEGHINSLNKTTAWATTIPGLRVRGLPYRNVGTLSNVAVSMGLWKGSPDIDAVQALANEPGAFHKFQPPTATRVMPAAQFFPLSGMNLAIRREVACLLYFAPMGLEQPYGRFDDIWCGLVLQRVCRHLGYPIVSGEPIVDHRRANDPFVSLVKEAAGIKANEHMWELVDAIALHDRQPLGCMREVGQQFRDAPRGDPYVCRWGEAIVKWCELFDGGADR